VKRKNIQKNLCAGATKQIGQSSSHFIFLCLKFWWIIDVLRENAQFALHMRGELYNNEKLMSTRWRIRRSGRKITQQGVSSGIGDHLGSIFGILGLARMRRTYFSQMARAWREVLFSQFLGLEWKLNFIKIVFSGLLLIGGWIYMFKECTSLLYYFHVNYV